MLKCGNPDALNNYCPVSLLPIVSKITERLVHEQLMEYLEIINWQYIRAETENFTALSVTPGYG